MSTSWTSLLGSLGFQELIVLLLIALVLFESKKLPELGRHFGATLGNFARMLQRRRFPWEEEYVEKVLNRATLGAFMLTVALIALLFLATYYG